MKRYIVILVSFALFSVLCFSKERNLSVKLSENNLILEDAEVYKESLIVLTTNNDPNDFYSEVIKISLLEGNIIWKKKLRNNDSIYERGKKLHIYEGNIYIMTDLVSYNKTNSLKNSNVSFYKLSQDGNILWNNISPGHFSYDFFFANNEIKYINTYVDGTKTDSSSNNSQIINEINIINQYKEKTIKYKLFKELVSIDLYGNEISRIGLNSSYLNEFFTNESLFVINEFGFFNIKPDKSNISLQKVDFKNKNVFDSVNLGNTETLFVNNLFYNDSLLFIVCNDNYMFKIKIFNLELLLVDEIILANNEINFYYTDLDIDGNNFYYLGCNNYPFICFGDYKNKNVKSIELKNTIGTYNKIFSIKKSIIGFFNKENSTWLDYIVLDL